MKIYVSHSSNMNFIEDIYNPIINSGLNNKYTFIFPHINTNNQFESKKFFENDCDLVIAEVSNPSIGLWIELWWANILEIPVICVYKKNSIISSSLKVVCNKFLEYSSNEELVNWLDTLI